MIVAVVRRLAVRMVVAVVHKMAVRMVAGAAVHRMAVHMIVAAVAVAVELLVQGHLYQNIQREHLLHQRRHSLLHNYCHRRHFLHTRILHPLHHS